MKTDHLADFLLMLCHLGIVCQWLIEKTNSIRNVNRKHFRACLSGRIYGFSPGQCIMGP